MFIIQQYQDGYAFRQSADYEIAVIEKKAEIELQRTDLTVSQLKLIREKAIYDIYKVESDYSQNIQDLRSKELSRLKEQTEKQVQAREDASQKAMNNELVLAAKVYAEQIKLNANNEEERKKITEDYQKQKLEIVRNYNQQAFEDEVRILEESLSNFTEDAELRDQILSKIDDLKKKNADEVADYDVKQHEDSVEKIMSLEEQFNKFLKDKRTQAVQNIWSQALDLANSYYDNELARLDEIEEREMKHLDDRLAKIQENESLGLISKDEAAAQEEIINATREAKEEEIAKKRKELELRQAKWDKANAAIQAGINTAVAFTAAMPNLVLAGIVAALGAAQIASIVAKQVPQYAQGGTHSGGLMIVGDGGKSELVRTPSGELYKTPDFPVFAMAPTGTQIFPDFDRALSGFTPLKGDAREDKQIFIFDEKLRAHTENTNKQIKSLSKLVGSGMKTIITGNNRNSFRGLSNNQSANNR